jgi:hypothetical protein
MTERHSMTRPATVTGAARAAREHAGRPASGWPALILRVAGSGLLIATAAIHLDLYLTGYRTIPTIGWLFLLQVIAAFGLGLAVLAIPRRLVTAIRLRSHLAADHAAMWPGSGPSAPGHLMPAVTTMEVSHDVRACRTNGFRRRPRLVVTAGG